MIDNFEDMPLQRILKSLTAVGLNSPPLWVRPYHVLSTGEQFRCNLARVLAAPRPQPETPAASRPLVVFDEFTSVVDRQVARTASSTLSRAIRRQLIRVRFVAVSCHYDIASWLEPDWILDMSTSKLARSCLRRPAIQLAVHRCDPSVWQQFRRHHYLDSSLNPVVRCYLATWEGTPVHFAATLSQLGKRRDRRFTRCVTLPEFQGIGIGTRVIEAVAREEVRQGYRIRISSIHPAIVSHCRRSPLWRTISVRRQGTRAPRFAPLKHYRTASLRPLITFQFQDK